MKTTNIPFIEEIKDRFFPNSGFVTGLDIGNSTVKLVKLKSTKEAVELHDFYLAESHSGSSELLKSWAQSRHIQSVNASVSGQATIIRYVSFPKMSPEELKKALKFEAQKYIPFSVGEVNLDAQIIRPNLPDNKMLVSVAAVKKDFIKQRIDLIEECGFNVNLIDLDSLALVNAFNFNYPLADQDRPKSVALLNIGASFSNLNILEDKDPLLSRDINIAGNNFTKKASDALEIDLKSAEKTKINPEPERAEALSKVMELVLSSLATEIRVSFDYFESQSASSVTKIFLSGGGGMLPGLKDMLANLLGIEVVFWDPLRKIQIVESVDAVKIKSSAAQLAVAIGLGLRK